MLAAQIEHGLDRGMNPRGGGIALHQDVADVKTLTKAVEHMGDVELIRIRTEKAALALQDVRRPVKTSLGKQRRLNARLRGMAGLDALRRSARVVILHHAPRKAGGQADGLCRLLRPFGAAEQKAGCGSRRADGPARAARLIPAIAMTRLHGKRCTAHALVTDRYLFQPRGSASCRETLWQSW